MFIGVSTKLLHIQEQMVMLLLVTGVKLLQTEGLIVFAMLQVHKTILQVQQLLDLEIMLHSTTDLLVV